MVLINGKEYITVAERINMLHEDHERVDILTEILSNDETVVLVKATIKIDGKIFNIEDNPELDKNKKHEIDLVVDRIVLHNEIINEQQRLADSVETCLNISWGLIIIEDDGEGYPKDILSKIREPYIKSLRSNDNSKSGLGLGIFIGKTLLEKNSAKLIFRNSETRGGAEIKIEWLNRSLVNI